MTETETRDHNANKQQQQKKQQNGGGPDHHRDATSAMVTANSTSPRDDVFDDTYREKQGPKPTMRLVWRNIILMSVLHVMALYGVVCVPAAQPLTLAWCKF